MVTAALRLVLHCCARAAAAAAAWGVARSSRIAGGVRVAAGAVGARIDLHRLCLMLLLQIVAGRWTMDGRCC